MLKSALFVAGIAATLAVSSGARASPASWTGFYAGGGLTFSDTTIGFPSGQLTGTVDGVTARDAPPTHVTGGHALAGYMLQRGMWVAALEGDVELAAAADIGHGFSSSERCLPGPCGVTSGRGSLDTFGHVRALFGYAFTPSVVGYVAAGAAFANGSYNGFYLAGTYGADSSNYIVVASAVDEIQKSMIGLSLGVGIEGKVTEHLVVRAEIIHDEYGFDTPEAASADAFAPVTINSDIDHVNFANTAARLALILKY
jgi:opacity protein-like surface antigen